jgi:hypothetical protein
VSRHQFQNGARQNPGEEHSNQTPVADTSTMVSSSCAVSVDNADCMEASESPMRAVPIFPIQYGNSGIPDETFVRLNQSGVVMFIGVDRIDRQQVQRKAAFEGLGDHLSRGSTIKA